jgi:hypothetical protein
MKKEYLRPEIQVVPISTSSVICASPGAGEQSDPSIGGGGGAPEFFSEDESFGTQDITTLMP